MEGGGGLGTYFTFGTGHMLGIFSMVPALTANTVFVVAIKCPIKCSFVIDLFPFLAVWRKGRVKDKVGPNLLIGGDCKILKRCLAI